MGKSESGGGASTYIYGLIFLLYAGIAVVLFIYMMNKRCFNYINCKLATGGKLELERIKYGNLSKTNHCCQPIKRDLFLPKEVKLFFYAII